MLNFTKVAECRLLNVWCCSWQVMEQVALLQERPEIPVGMPEEYAALMTAAWAQDPFARPTFAEIQRRLKGMLDGIVQEEADAADRFVSDL